MRMPRLGPVLGGLATSFVAKRLGARHAGKLAIAVTAWQLWNQYRDYRRSSTPQPDGPGQGWTQGRQATGPAPTSAPHPKRRWSGRRV